MNNYRQTRKLLKQSANKLDGERLKTNPDAVRLHIYSERVNRYASMLGRL